MMTGVFTNDMCIYFGEKVSVISVIIRHFFLEDSQMQLHLNNEQEKIYFLFFQQTFLSSWKLLESLQICIFHASQRLKFPSEMSQFRQNKIG